MLELLDNQITTVQRFPVVVTFQCFHSHCLRHGTRQWPPCSLQIRQQMSFVHHPKLTYRRNMTQGLKPQY